MTELVDIISTCHKSPIWCNLLELFTIPVFQHFRANLTYADFVSTYYEIAEWKNLTNYVQLITLKMDHLHYLRICIFAI